MSRDTLISAEENRSLFNRIARRYDAVNRLISLGLDRGWRRQAVKVLMPREGGRYLDVGTGTGELAFEILRQAPESHVDGIDPSEKMLSIAREKAARDGLANQASFVLGDARALDLADGLYDGAVLGFSFRNIEDRSAALSEICRVLNPGGRLVILEAVYPERRLFQWGLWFFTWAIPSIGRLLGRGVDYRYLLDSVRDFPNLETVAGTLRAAGFGVVSYRSLVFGAVSIFSGERPQT